MNELQNEYMWGVFTGALFTAFAITALWLACEQWRNKK